MWDKNTNYISLFFEWTWNGSLWISKDPVDFDRRWIIKEYGSQYNSSMKFIGNYVKNSLPEGGSTMYGVCESQVAYGLVGRRLEQIADYLYNNQYLSKEDEKARCQQTLLELIYLRFSKEPPNDLPKEKEVTVKETETIMV